MFTRRWYKFKFLSNLDGAFYIIVSLDSRGNE